MILQYKHTTNRIDYAGIKAAVSMAAVLEDYTITPQKQKIRCPFHNDQHPSMQIYPDGYYCFSCGNGGDIFNFVAQMESVSIKQAAALIMARHGLSYGVANPAIQRRLNAERKAQQELEEASSAARDALCTARRADGGSINEWDYWLDYLDEDPKGFFDNGGEEAVKRAREFTRRDLQNRETYAHIMQIQDEQARLEYLEDLKLSARNEKMLTEVKTRINDARQGMKHAQSGKYTLFSDAPFPPFLCGQWLCNDDGIYKEAVDDNFTLQHIRICPHPICPTARLVNVDTGAEHLCIDYKRDGRWRQIIIERSAVADKSQIVRNLSNKIEVTSETARDMVRFIADIIALNQDTIPAHKSADHLGWTTTDTSRLFIPYADTITFDGEARFASAFSAVQEEGRFEIWRYTMHALRQHSKLFRLVMAASFASPLLELLDALPFVLHLWGGTGAGKTVAAMCAMSVWGDPGKGRLMWSMDSTKVFFSQTAAFLRNIPFYGDELQTIDTRYQSMDKLIMHLCEGTDRGRGTASGGIQTTKSWADAFLFTGEQAISSSASGGGVKNRLIEVQLKDGDVLVPDGNAVVGLITANYGHAGRIFINYITDQLKANPAVLSDRYRELQRLLIGNVDTTDKQAYSMAAILLADEIACRCIFPNDDPLTMEDVTPYLQSKKDVDVAGRAYDWTLDWIDRNHSRWEGKETGNYGECWGRLSSEVATINRSVLSEALEAAGYPYSACISAWAERGLILKATGGRFVHNSTYNGHKGSCIKLILTRPRLP